MKNKPKDPLSVQLREWAKSLMKVNPDYVTDPGRLIPYIKGPNWDDPDIEYAHYRNTISLYGKELLEFFENIRSIPDQYAQAEYRKAIFASLALQKYYEEKALNRAEEFGIVEYEVNGNLMEYWSFYDGEGWYFVRYDLDMKVEVFRGANIPFYNSLGTPIPAFLVSPRGGLLYNYNIG